MNIEYNNANNTTETQLTTSGVFVIYFVSTTNTQLCYTECLDK